jgi:uncharacterized membrane protein YhaH (DUF805 family)
VASLTRPTRGRLTLWIVLAVLWFLFLPQYLVMSERPSEPSVAGVVLWVAVLGWLVTCAAITWKKLRAIRK